MKTILAVLLAFGLAAFLLVQGVTQEVPIGGVHGRVTMLENGRPMPKALVTLTLQSTTEDEAVQVRYAETNAKGEFTLRNVPTGTYDIDVSAQYHSLSTNVVEVKEGKPSELNLKMKPGDERLAMYASQRVFSHAETPEIELHGFVKTDSVAVDIRRVELAEIAKNAGLQETLSPLASAQSPKLEEVERIAPLMQTVTHAVKKKDAEGAFIDNLDIPHLPEGVYWVTARVGKTRADTAVIVSDLAMVAKVANGRALCFATDIMSGKPVAGTEISAQGSEGLQTLGTTDADGVFTAQVPFDSNGRGALVAQHGKSVAVIGLWRSESERKRFHFVGYTDRPVYRPGDLVQFRGVYRGEPGSALPDAGAVEIEVFDPDSNSLAKQTVTMGAHGSFHGEFRTVSEAKPGAYRVQAKTTDGETHDFYVAIAAYRKPEYKIDVREKDGPYFLGDTVSAVIDCQYYFGGPVAGAKVEATIYRAPSFGAGESEETMPESATAAGEYSQTIEAVTDSAGRAVISFPTRADDDPADMGTDYEYTISASVADTGDKYFTGEGQIVVTRGSYAVSLESDTYVTKPSSTVRYTVGVSDALNIDKKVANVPVDLEVGLEKWTNNASVILPRTTLHAETNAEGQITFDVPVNESGDVVVWAKVRDPKNRLISSERYLWVEGARATDGRPAPVFKVLLDKETYVPGDTAKVLIQTDRPGGSALLTVQAEDVRFQQVVPLTESSTLVTLPVTAAYAPNVFVSAVYIREKELREDTHQLTVNRNDRALSVSIEPEKKKYQPGDTVRLRVRTKDADGKPAPAEVSVAVVDESIFAIRESTLDIQDELNPRRYDSVQTLNSFPEIYLDGGDKGSADMAIRRKFLDTAAWLPEVWTGPTGDTVVEVKLPDNLTEWRATAVGVTDSGASGQDAAKFRVSKPLMIRLSPPPYLIQGDDQRMAISVTNDTAQDANVRVDLDATGIATDGDRSWILVVPAGGSSSADVTLRANKVGEAKVTATVMKDKKVVDGVEQTFRVMPHGREKVEVQSARVKRSETFTFAVEPNAVPDVGGLRLRLSPTIAGTLVQSLDTLVDFPYGCVEQTMSRFLPAVVVGDSLGRLGIEKPELMARVPLIADDSMARLGKMQHYDGGWGWWTYDESDPFMTALVLDGLDRANHAGYPSKFIRVKEAIQWAKNRFATPKATDSLRGRLYLGYVLLRLGEKVDGLEKLDLGQGSGADFATAALAYDLAGKRRLRDDALARLRMSADESGGMIRFAGSEDAYGEEPNAVALEALLELRPRDRMIPKIVAGLMARRRDNGAWVTTRDTSYTVLSLTHYLVKTGELRGSPTVTVTVNGRTIRTVTLDPRAPEGETLELRRNELTPGPLLVTVARQGGGTVYVNAELRQTLALDRMDALSTDPAVTVDRTFNVLEARQLQNGTARLLPSEKPVGNVQSGDLMRVTVTVNASLPREYVMVEVPIPSNCHVVEREGIGEYETWGQWWSDFVIRDDRVAFFARNVKAGKSEFTFNVRAEGVGNSHALPAHLENMYEPDHRASSAEAPMEVRR